MCVLSIKVPIRKKSGNLYAPRISICCIQGYKKSIFSVGGKVYSEHTVFASLIYRILDHRIERISFERDNQWNIIFKFEILYEMVLSKSSFFK